MLRRLGSGASIEAVCAEAGLSRATFDTWWSAELTSRLPQTTGFAPVQLPAWQVSAWVQAFESLQPVPLALAGFEHAPVAGSQVPASWH